MILCSAGAALLGAAAGRATGWGRHGLIAGTVLSVVVAAWVKIAQTRREKAVKEAKTLEDARLSALAQEQHARDLTTFGSVIKPGIEQLALLASSRRKSKEQAQHYAAIRNRMVDAAATLSGGQEQVRAVFFSREDRDGVRTLVRSEYSGAREPSGRVFRDSEDDLAGLEAWKALEVGKVVTWSNVEVDFPTGFMPDTRSRPYLTFTMAPVLGPEQQIYGMLNVDALEADSLGRLDEERLAALAALLGAAVHLVAGEEDVA